MPPRFISGKVEGSGRCVVVRLLEPFDTHPAPDCDAGREGAPRGRIRSAPSPSPDWRRQDSVADRAILRDRRVSRWNWMPAKWPPGRRACRIQCVGGGALSLKLSTGAGNVVQQSATLESLDGGRGQAADPKTEAASGAGGNLRLARVTGPRGPRGEAHKRETGRPVCSEDYDIIDQ
jgi:hypothetical protein